MHHPFASAHSMRAALQAKNMSAQELLTWHLECISCHNSKNLFNKRKISKHVCRGQIQPLPGIAIRRSAGLPALDEPTLEAIVGACYQAVLP